MGWSWAFGDPSFQTLIRIWVPGAYSGDSLESFEPWLTPHKCIYPVGIVQWPWYKDRRTEPLDQGRGKFVRMTYDWFSSGKFSWCSLSTIICHSDKFIFYFGDNWVWKGSHKIEYILEPENVPLFYNMIKSEDNNTHIYTISFSHCYKNVSLIFWGMLTLPLRILMKSIHNNLQKEIQSCQCETKIQVTG